MDNNEFTLYVKFPAYFYVVAVGAMILLPLYDLIYIYDLSLKRKMTCILLLIPGLIMLISVVAANVFHKTGYTITREKITFFLPLRTNVVLWEHIVSYNITGSDKTNDAYLYFYTEQSLRNRGILKSRYALRIPARWCNITIEELLVKINEIRG
jgi:hypothetical protein